MVLHHKVALHKINPTETMTRNFPLLLFEHVLCKESVIVMKKFDFEILTYLYVLRSPEFIYAIFTVMYACMCECESVCE